MSVRPPEMSNSASGAGEKIIQQINAVDAEIAVSGRGIRTSNNELHTVKKNESASGISSLVDLVKSIITAIKGKFSGQQSSIEKREKPIHGSKMPQPGRVDRTASDLAQQKGVAGAGKGGGQITLMASTRKKETLEASIPLLKQGILPKIQLDEDTRARLKGMLKETVEFSDNDKGTKDYHLLVAVLDQIKGSLEGLKGRGVAAELTVLDQQIESIGQAIRDALKPRFGS